MKHKRTLAISDLHLGRTHSHIQTPEQLKSLIEGFDEVYLLGDIVDHWYLSPHQILDFETRIEQLARDAGVKKLRWFRGNHDANTSHAQEFGVFHGVLYLHGHAIYHKLAKAGSASEKIEELNARKFGPKRLGSRKEKPVWKLVDNAYRRVPQVVARPFTWTPKVRKRLIQLVQEIAGATSVHAVVFGHDHLPGARKAGDLQVFNLGGWMQNTEACAFVREGQRFRLHKIMTDQKKPLLGSVAHELAL